MRYSSLILTIKNINFGIRTEGSKELLVIVKIATCIGIHCMYILTQCRRENDVFPSAVLG